MTTSNSMQVKRRLDYRVPDFLIPTVDLSFNIESDVTRVKSKLRIKRNGQHSQPLILDGESLQLIEVKLNGKSIDGYQQTDTQLTIESVPDEFILEIFTEIDPAANSSLEGLYKASGAYCSQCEAEGFRKITYFLDRPDVLSEYTVVIFANKTLYPYLLSNGNQVDSGDLDEATHWVKWHDPFKKPCYLFALVAGKFDLLEDQFETLSGRTVALQLYVDEGKKERGHHALESLKRAMRWDEKVFGLEYDLDIYMIVAVDFFNMGAMENKGLNVFNSKYVLANSDTATDEDYFNIESVIAHEYFHNWTGNRVTCRDWFQLSLKEGLTVFRDQQFSGDMSSPVVNRIKNVKVIKEHQFAEDASAMSHPIRPDEVIEMNNFYTVTVYDKGSEVIRMLHTLLGQEGFRRGMDMYFKRHDGQAVTCDDFVNAMQDANSVDLSQFKLWYSQSGTPVVTVEEHFDELQQTLTLIFEQRTLPTADQAEKSDLQIPIKLEFISGQDSTESAIELFNLKSAKQTLVKNNVTSKPAVSLLAGFSAPVKLNFPHTATSLFDIALHSQDGYSRWDAATQLYSHYIHSLTPIGSITPLIDVQREDIAKLVEHLLTNEQDDLALLAEMLTLPSVETLVQQVPKYFVDELCQARQTLELELAVSFEPLWLAMYQQQDQQSYIYSAEQVNSRKIKNLSLHYLAKTSKGEDWVKNQFVDADNMTDTLGALKAAQQACLTNFESLSAEFEQKWSQDPLVLDKWFALHAGAQNKDILARLDLLTSHQNYTINNPNRVRSVVGTFAFYNPQGFHRLDGSGYKYVTDYLLKLDSINPQVAARIVTPLTQWHKLDETRAELMKLQLLRLLDTQSLSKDVYEKVSKSLSYH
ncbi:aminopeptidase N [Aliiglaciecola sp. LCG003]|uniref:aminopeptidase N n=1 Tax=Aliiglaciecola sp. LCG003 TaxID=3053655 RepID=UPI00257258AE|nr:aminopeptidase N [Aliiglaciecola sp. LCG003]WJG07656.1 aminopeptidase N [Aliiglaciecola sp. LCG003]